MLQTPHISPRPLTVPTEARPQLQVLPAGRVLHAGVRRGDEGRLVAVAGRLRLALPTGTGLAPGDEVALRVTRNAAGQQGVELLAAPPQKADALTRLQRIHLPRQQPVAQGVRRLVALPAQTLPEPAARTLEPVLASLPTPGTLNTAEGVRTALRDAGTLLESSLVARPDLAGAITKGNLRSELLRLAAALRAGGSRGDSGPASPTPATSRTAQDAEQTVTGVLARQLLHQLAAHQADGRVALTFELPVAHAGAIDALRVSFREEAADEQRNDHASTTEAEEHARWHVDVSLAFADAGALEARVYYDSSGLGITWWADNDSLRRVLAAETPRLTDALADAGLYVHSLRVSDQPPNNDIDRNPTGVRGLIDERA